MPQGVDNGRSDESYTQLEQSTWLACIRTGDVAAFEQMFRAWYDDLVGFAMALVGSMARAEDVVSDVFADVWARHATLDVRDTLRAYLFGAVRRRAISLYRRDNAADRALDRALHDSSAMDTLHWPSMPSQPDAHAMAHELTDAVTRAIAALPPRAREAMLLKHEHGLTYPEIASVMGLSVKTVELHIARAFRGLREALDDFR